MAVGVGLGLAGLGTVASGVLGYMGAQEQAAAAERAAAAQQQVALQGMANAQQAGMQGAKYIGMATPWAGQLMSAGASQGIGEMQRGRDMALGQLAGYGGQARQDILGGLMGAQGALGSFMPNSRVEQLLSNPQGYMAQDPGYAFRQQQGEQALARTAAARGGRVSSRAMQEQASFNQGLASEEFGNAFQRAALSDQQRLGVLGQQAQLAAQGGQTLAGQQSNLGSNLANLLVGSGQNIGQAHLGLGGNMANLLMQGAMGQSNAIMGAANAASPFYQAQMNAIGSSVPYQGGGLTALGNAAAQLGALGLHAGLKLGGGGGPDLDSLAEDAAHATAPY